MFVYYTKGSFHIFTYCVEIVKMAHESQNIQKLWFDKDWIG